MLHGGLQCLLLSTDSVCLHNVAAPCRCGVDTPEEAAALAEQVCTLGAAKDTAGAVRFAGIQVSRGVQAADAQGSLTRLQHHLQVCLSCFVG